MRKRENLRMQIDSYSVQIIRLQAQEQEIRYKRSLLLEKYYKKDKGKKK